MNDALNEAFIDEEESSTESELQMMLAATLSELSEESESPDSSTCLSVLDDSRMIEETDEVGMDRFKRGRPKVDENEQEIGEKKY